jgi:hypothetical protein
MDGADAKQQVVALILAAADPAAAPSPRQAIHNSAQGSYHRLLGMCEDSEDDADPEVYKDNDSRRWATTGAGDGSHAGHITRSQGKTRPAPVLTGDEPAADTVGHDLSFRFVSAGLAAAERLRAPQAGMARALLMRSELREGEDRQKRVGREAEWGPVGEAGRTRGAGGVGGQVGREQKHNARPSGATGEAGKAERRRAAGQRGKAAKLRRLSSPTVSTPKWVPH